MMNSEEYGWNDSHVMVLGRPILQILGIKYSEEQEKKNIYGKGKKPRKRGRGRVTFPPGELKVSSSELWAFMQSHGNGKSILSIKPFDIVHAFAPEEGGVVSTNILKYVEFTGVGIDLSEGAPDVEVTLPFLPGDIEWNV
ncbi:hypothetical protein [Reichenbachiella sp.]|uniref:hypothetical protein n=1 Tax=Reichenbachiella sp. TaxID=2184521 RepID=UPI003B5AA41A